MRRFRRVTVAITFALSFLLPVSSALAAPGPIDGPALAHQLANLVTSAAGPALPLIRALDGTQAIDDGNDGRLTFLLVGSDASGVAIARTDTIMVVSVKGSTISAASIPRDTKRMPNPFQGGTYGKVNSILRYLHNTNGRDLTVALDKFEIVIENALGIEIDYHALIWFAGFTTLVDQVDGGARVITVQIARRIYDSTHHDQPGTTNPGVYFPQATNYRLYAQNPIGQTGSPYCNGTFKNYADPTTHPETWCHRALPFVRTRHGSSDWARARRQQSFVDATINAVDLSELNSLVSVGVLQGRGKWWTNFPISGPNALELYNALQGASLVNSVVFGPTTYATRIPGTHGYQLNLSAVRSWCDTYMS